MVSAGFHKNNLTFGFDVTLVICIAQNLAGLSLFLNVLFNLNCKAHCIHSVFSLVSSPHEATCRDTH